MAAPLVAKPGDKGGAPSKGNPEVRQRKSPPDHLDWVVVGIPSHFQYLPNL